MLFILLMTIASALFVAHSRLHGLPWTEELCTFAGVAIVGTAITVARIAFAILTSL